MLIGRAAEQKALAQLAAAARVSESGALVVVGDAGLGKTALLCDLADGCSGLRTLWVRGSESERELPFGGLDQLLRPLLGLRADIPAPQARALDVALVLAPGTQADRFAISAATLSVLGRAAEEQPLLVVVDDAHALDRPSAEALAFVCRRILADPIAVVVASRPADSPLLEAGLPRLDLVGLSPSEVTRLLSDRSPSATVTADLGARVHGATAGNPLAVVELAPTLDALEHLTPAAPFSVPGRVLAEYVRRTTTLDEPTRRALLLASVATTRTLSAPSAAEVGLALDDLAAAEAAGLVTLRPGVLEFRHPLARAGAYAAASPRQRREAHLAVAAVASDPDRRAWHLGEGTVGLDDRVADEVAAAAQRTLARGAYSVAATGFERAARLTAARGRRAARLLLAGRAATAAGHGARAAALLDEAAAESGEPLHRGEVDALRAVVEQRWGSVERSRDLAARALPLLTRAAPDLAVDTATDLVATCFYLGDTETADRAAALLDEAAPGASPEARLRALLAGGVARVLAGRDGLAEINEAMSAMTAVTGPPGGLPGADEALRPSWLVIGPLFVREESPAAHDLVAQALRQLREGSALGPLASLLFHVARYSASTDRWDEAAEEYREGMAMARESRQTTDLAMLVAGLAWLEARTGAAASCREHAAEALALAERHHVHMARIWAAYALGDLELGLGRPQEALSHYTGVESWLARIHFRDVDVSPAPEIVECLHRTGRHAEAGPVAQAYRERARAKGQRWALARAERVCALGAPDPAPGLLEALALHAAGADLFEQARTRLMLGEHHRRTRRRLVAREFLGDALDAFERLGAHPWAERAATELRATGIRAHRRSDRSIDLLTPQELQVARLLGAGRTTRQAAAVMYLSPKTVEYHLRHVYTKLGVNARDDLAAALAGDLPGPSGSAR